MVLLYDFVLWKIVTGMYVWVIVLNGCYDWFMYGTNFIRIRLLNIMWYPFITGWVRVCYHLSHTNQEGIFILAGVLNIINYKKHQGRSQEWFDSHLSEYNHPHTVEGGSTTYRCRRYTAETAGFNKWRGSPDFPACRTSTLNATSWVS